MIINTENKTARIHVRVKPTEKEALIKLAKANNMNLSDFVFAACNEYAKKLEEK